MVGARLHPETASAIAARHKAGGALRHRPVRSHLPLWTAINLRELDSRLIRIFPTRADSNRSPPDPNRFKKGVFKRGRSVGELDLGPVADRVDDRDARDGVILMALAGVSIRARIESQNHLT